MLLGPGSLEPRFQLASIPSRSLYVCSSDFVDFKAAFDTVWRKALWKMMVAIEVDPQVSLDNRIPKQ